jgi:hypothetical protein
MSKSFYLSISAYLFSYSYLNSSSFYLTFLFVKANSFYKTVFLLNHSSISYFLTRTISAKASSTIEFAISSIFSSSVCPLLKAPSTDINYSDTEKIKSVPSVPAENKNLLSGLKIILVISPAWALIFSITLSWNGF